MHTGAYTPGGIENGILVMAFSQMVQFYNVPSAGYVGLTNSKVVDAQAGFEKSLSPMAAVDLVNMSGLIDALMVIDDEIAAMIKRVKRRMEYSEENLALDAIASAGLAGMFIDTPHILERMKTCAFLPEIADRAPRQTWVENGARDARTRAMQRVREILTRDNPAAFSPDVDARVRAEFVGLVPGDSLPPASWKAPEPPRRRYEVAG